MTNTALYVRISVLHWGNDVEIFVSKSSLSLWRFSLDGLASSHVLRLTLSGAPKILLYWTEYRRPMTISYYQMVPPSDETSWWEKVYMRRWTNVIIIPCLVSDWYGKKLPSILTPLTGNIIFKTSGLLESCQVKVNGQQVEFNALTCIDKAPELVKPISKQYIMCPEHWCMTISNNTQCTKNTSAW